VSLVLTALALRFASAYGKLLLVPCYGRNAVRPLKNASDFIASVLNGNRRTAFAFTVFRNARCAPLHGEGGGPRVDRVDDREKRNIFVP